MAVQRSAAAETLSRCAPLGRQLVLFRITKKDQLFKDIIALGGKKRQGGPILKLVMKDGKRRRLHEPSPAMRDRFQAEFRTLDDRRKLLKEPQLYPDELSPGLRELQKQVTREVVGKQLGESSSQSLEKSKAHGRFPRSVRDMPGLSAANDCSGYKKEG